MAAPKNLVFAKRYNDKQTNEEKTQWITCGKVFFKTTDQGEERISIKLDVIPVGVTGEIWFYVMEPRERVEGTPF